MHVLLIEDQHDIAANVWDFLERRGHVVDHCADGASGLTRALTGGFDAIVLDLGLPKLDGLNLCRQLRVAGYGVPVLMLTARDTLDDIVRGFNEGRRRLHGETLRAARTRSAPHALHKRATPTAGAPMSVGGLAYDTGAMAAVREGRRIPLSRSQGALLATLLRNAPNVSTHAQLMRAAWGNEDAGDLAALHTHIHALRALVDRPFGTALIKSVRGVGYRLEAAE